MNARLISRWFVGPCLIPAYRLWILWITCIACQWHSRSLLTPYPQQYEYSLQQTKSEHVNTFADCFGEMIIQLLNRLPLNSYKKLKLLLTKHFFLIKKQQIVRLYCLY